MKNRHTALRTLPATLTLALLLTACSGEDPAKLVDSAKAYLAKDDAAAAVIQLKNALQANPDLAEARFLLGKAWLEQGDVAGAQVEFEKAQAAGYAEAEVIPMLAKAWLAQGQAKKVTDAYDQKSLSTPESQAELLTVLAAAWLAQGQTDVARQKVDAALQAQPQHVGARLMDARMVASKGDTSAALAKVSEILKTDPAHVQAIKLKADLELFGLGQPDQAVATYREALKLAPNSPDVRSNIARIFMGLGKLPEAQRELDELVKLAPNSAQTLYLQAQLAVAHKDFKVARSATDKLMRNFASNPQVLELAGTVEFNANALVQAETLLTKALAAAPDLRVARRVLGLVHLRQGQVDKAIALLPKDESTWDKDPGMLSVAGQAYMLQGEHERAQVYFEKAAALDPKDPAKRTTLAVSRFTAGQTQAAMNELQDIAAADSGVMADMTMVNLLSRQKRWDEALKALANLEAKRPANDPLPKYLRAQVLGFKGDKAASRASLEAALKVAPEFFPAVSMLASLDASEKKFDAAEAHLQAYLKRQPKSVDALLALARLKGLKEGDAAVLTWLRKAVDAAPDEPRAHLALISYQLKKGQSKDALTAAQTAVSALPQNPELLDALGQAQIEAKELNQALSTYGKLVDLLPHSVTPHMRSAAVHVANQDVAGATQSLRKALAIKADYLPAQQALVDLAMRNKRPDDALGVVREVQKQRPQEATGWAIEGQVHQITGAYPAAATAYQQALKLAPQSTDLAVRFYGVKMGAKQSAEAEQFAATWMKNHPKDAGFLIHLGDRAVTANQFKLAETQYQKAVNLQPQNPIALNNLAWVAGKNGRPDAVALAEKAVALAPQSPAVLDTLANLLASNGQVKEAIEVQKRIIALQPEAGVWQLGMAKLLIQSGDKAGAKAQLVSLQKQGNKFSAQAEVERLLKSL